MISIIIPVFNVEQYIGQCLESIVSQTIDHSIIECIIVNDCTTDNSMEFVNRQIEKCQANNDKITYKVINHINNMGVSTSRNDGLDAAKGEFVFFIDADDYLYPDCLKTLYNAHLKYTNSDLIIGNAYNESLNTLMFKIKECIVLKNMNYLYEGKIADYTIWNKLIRRNILQKNDIKFKSDINISEDDLFNYQLHSVVNEAVILPQKTYFYRKNEMGQTFKYKYANASTTLNGYITILSLYEKELKGKCYLGKSFFVFNLASRAIDFLNNNKNNISDVKSLERQLRIIIRGILNKHIMNIRPILFFMTILATKPFEWVMRMRFYRRYFDKISMLFWKPAMMMDIFHGKKL